MIDLPLLIGNWLLDNNLEFIHHCRTHLNCQIIRKHNCSLYIGKDLFIIYRGDTATSAIATSAIMLEEVDYIGVMYYETGTDVRYPNNLGEIKELKLWVGDPEWDKTLLGIIKINGTGGEIHGTRFS